MNDTKHPRRSNLRRDSAATYLKDRYGLRCSAATLKKYASRGGGPRFHRVNRTALYPIVELDRWAVQKLGPLQAGVPDRPPGAPITELDESSASVPELN